MPCSVQRASLVPLPANHAHGLPTGGAPRSITILWVAGLAVALLMAIKNPLILPLLLTEGTTPCLILAASLGIGITLLRLFGLSELSRAERLLFGMGLGLGALSTLVLLLGCAGWLNRSMWCCFVVLASIGGILVLVRNNPLHSLPDQEPAPRRWRWLWLGVVPFLALALMSASVPPGYLWVGEGNGYDVLEYHLQMPKEYFEAGQIRYAPHNIYANFPANVEMLYLLSMILKGSAIGAAIACKYLNAGLAILVVASVGLCSSRNSLSRVAACVAAASTGWLVYLSGVAYVENGMLLFGLLATVAVLRAVRGEEHRLGWCALAGLLAGFAIGCKYPALVFIGLPLAIALMGLTPGKFAPRGRSAMVFLLFQAIGFMPWAIKNTVMTANPVFPLANQLFEANPPGWGFEESMHFADVHKPGPDETGLANRFAAFWRHIPADPTQRIGVMILLLGSMSAWVNRRRKIALLALLMLAVQIPVWLFFTHLYARFAVPLLVPLFLLLGAIQVDPGWRRRGVLILLAAGCLCNLFFAGRLYVEHMVPGGKRFNLEGVPEFFAEGAGLAHEHLEVINRDLPTDACILLLGDARAFYFERRVDYCVVFNRNPFIERVESAEGLAEISDWLEKKNYTHVLVNWAEINRLRSSRYGFSDSINHDLFDALTEHDLKLELRFRTPSLKQPFADLYSVSAGRE